MLGLGLGLGLSRVGRSIVAIIRDGLKAFYRFRDTTPDFLLEGSTSFDGTDYIDTGSTFQTTLRSSFSIAMWAKPSDGIPSAYNQLFACKNSTEQDRLYFYIDTSGKFGGLYISDNDASEATTASAVFSNGQQEWHHLVMVVNDETNQIALYVNGSLQTLDGTNDGDLSGVTFADYTSDINPVIGAQNYNGTIQEHFTGSIANVGIWSRALSASEIESIQWRGSYSELQHTELTNLVSWYDLDSISVGSSLVTNGTFSSDTTGWSGGNASLASVSGGQSGNCIEITMSSAGASLAYQWVAGLTSGKSYQFNAYVKSGTSGNDACKIELRASDGAEVLGTTSTTSTDTWTKISVIGSPKSGQVGVYLYLIRTTTDAGTILFDTVSGDKVQVLDSKGSNDGDVYGATVNTDSYSGTSPFKPRIKDIAQPKMAVQLADGSTSFDGDDYISLGNDSSLQVGTSDFSLCAWVYRTADDGAIFSWGDIASPPGWQLYESGAELLRLRIDDGGGSLDSYSSTALPEDEWVHICLTMDRNSATGIKMYFNGSDVGVTEDDATGQQLTFSGGSIGAYIGARYGGGLASYHSGKIANVGLWTRALTQTQIQEVMFAEKYSGLTSDQKTNLVSWYDLGDTSLGSEMVTGGDCSTDSFTKGTGWTYDSVNEQYDASLSGETYLEQNIGITVPNIFQVKYTVSNYSAGAVKSSIGGYHDGTTITANGTYTDDIPATNPSTASIFYIIGNSSFVGSIDDISVKKVQATDYHGSNEGSISGATVNTGYTSSPHGVVDPLNLGSVYSGTAVRFDGATDDGLVTMALASGTYSVSFWASQDDQGGEYLFDCRDSSGTGFTYFSGATPAVVTPNNGTVYVNGEQSTTVNHGIWYHICISGITLEASSVRLGSFHNGSDFPYDGMMSNFKIFDTTLTEAQVQEMYLNPEQILPTGVASSNLKLYLPMQEGTGSYVYDGSGNQNHGTLTGCTWVPSNNQGYQNALVRSNAPMIFGGAGSGDYVELDAAKDFLTLAADWSLSLWVKLDALSTGNEQSIFSSQIGVDDRVQISQSNGASNINITLDESTYYHKSTAITANTWYHVMLVWDTDPSGLTAYLDGAVMSGTTGVSALGGATGMDIGRQVGAQADTEIGGLINEVAIWDEILTASEVTALYNSGTPLVPTADSGNYESSDALQGYWRNDNVTTWTDRANTGVASFDGSDDKLTVSHHSSLAPSAISMCGWFKPTTFATNAGIFNKDAAGANDGDWNIRSHSTGSGKLEHYVQDGSNTVIIVSDSAITLGAWSHFVITYDGTMKMYINGTLQSDTDTSTCDITNNGNDAQMGCHLTGSFFDGQLAGYHIFNVALSASEVTELYALDKRASISGHSKFSNCVGSWLMGAGTGDTTSTIQDQTSSNNDATVSGASLVGYNDGTVSGSPADILLPEGTTEGRDTQGFLLTDTTSISNGIRLHGAEYVDLDTGGGLANFWTLECWFKLYKIPGEMKIIHYRPTSGDANDVRMFINNSKLCGIAVGSGGSGGGATYKHYEGATTLSLETWYHGVVTWDGQAGTLNVYLNASADTSYTKTSDGTVAMTDTTRNRQIGKNAVASSEYFNGQIDEVRIYSKVLSATEITTNYNNGKSAHS